MKLRLRDDSIRFRLTRSEVAALVNGDTVESRTQFGPDAALTYRVIASGDRIAATFGDGLLTVTIPSAQLRSWAAGADLSILHEQTWNGGALRLAIEKDLACTKARAGDDDADTFPNPAAHCR